MLNEAETEGQRAEKGEGGRNRRASRRREKRFRPDRHACPRRENVRCNRERRSSCAPQVLGGLLPSLEELLLPALWDLEWIDQNNSRHDVAPFLGIIDAQIGYFLTRDIQLGSSLFLRSRETVPLGLRSAPPKRGKPFAQARPLPRQQAGSREQWKHGKLHNGGQVRHARQREVDVEHQNESCHQMCDTLDVTDLLIGNGAGRHG